MKLLVVTAGLECSALCRGDEAGGAAEVQLVEADRAVAGEAAGEV